MTSIRYLGHSAFLIKADNGTRVLIDPFLSGNPYAPVQADEVECDVICVSHGHRDHLGDAVAIAKRTGAPVVAIFEVAQYVASKGVENVTGMNFGGSVEVKGVKLTLVPAVHSGGIVEDGGIIYGGASGGFVIDAGMKIYHAGDTALFGDMKVIQELYRPEVALLPIGDVYTMDPRAAAIAVSWLKPRYVIPMHYKTFPVIIQDAGTFIRAVEDIKQKEGLDTEVIPLKIGEERTL